MDAKCCGLLVFCFYLSRASYESPWRLALAVELGQGMMGEKERRRSGFEKDSGREDGETQGCEGELEENREEFGVEKQGGKRRCPD